MTRHVHVRPCTFLVSALLSLVAAGSADAAPLTASQDVVAAIDALRPSKLLGARLDTERPETIDGVAAVQRLSDQLIAAQLAHADWQQAGHSASVEALLVALADTASGKARLPESALCLADRGLPKLLVALPTKDKSRSSLENALSQVCQTASQFASLPEPEPILMLSMFGSAPELQDKNLNFDWLCARAGVRTPDMPGVNPFYELSGYQTSPAEQTAYLEEGQRIAAKVICAPKVIDGITNHYGVRISLNYTPAGGSPKTVVLSSFATDGQTFSFPSDFFPANFATSANPAPSNGTLRYQPYRRACVFNCSYTALGIETVLPISVARLGSFCSAGLRYNDFTINDRLVVEDEWQSNYANNVVVNGPTYDWNVQFRAYARTITTSQVSIGGTTFTVATSSFPAYNPITNSTPFAVHRDDELEIHDPTISRATFIDTVGTTRLSALRYPRVVGNNWLTQDDFSYTCRPERIVRDYVAFCSLAGKPVDSLYLLPYRGKTLTVQGNNGSISHNDDMNRFAWDFETEAASYKGIYAARSGQVIAMEEGQSGNCPGCANNFIFVRHQDGSEAHYLHGQTNGTEVEVGDIVRRGQYLGESGNVGNSAIRHIHFSAHSGTTGNSIRSSFDDQSEPCVIPVGPFDTKESTLTPGQDRELKYLSFPQLGLPQKR